MLNFADAHRFAPAKTATMHTVSAQPRMADPLDHPETAPAQAIPNWQRHGRRAGMVAGAGAGAALGAILPPALGALAGWGVGEGVQHLGVPLGDYAPAAGAIAGGAAGLPLSPIGAVAGGLRGAHAGESLGKSMGAGIESRYDPHRVAVDKVRRMPPAEAYAFIRAKERVGAHPDELAQMREAYTARRDGLRDQVHAGII